MFTRGGVYRVVKEAMGGTLAKLSVSALMFDYILTGPISGVSAGQYIVGLLAQTVNYFRPDHPWNPSADTINHIAAGIAILVTVYFWWRNTRGIHESSDDALKIMYVTTVMVVLLIAWCGITILTKPEAQKLPPAPAVRNLTFNDDAVGWMPRLIPDNLRSVPARQSAALDEKASASDGAASTSNNAAGGTSVVETGPHYKFVQNAGALLGLVGILMAFGHSFLAMSGEESLAQVNRELEYPKHRNLMKAGMVIFLYSLLFTSLVSFLAYAIIPDNVRPQYFNNLISGISMYLVGPLSLRLLFQAFIVIVGFLMLAGAINTSIIGANGVLNRVSEDGVMTDWFRAPHKRFGTTYRMINLIAILQLVAIIGSRGNTFVLGEAYAFGVIWSFFFNSLSMTVLRFQRKERREWKVPLNIRVGGKEIPLGLGAIMLILFCVAAVNLVTKQVATVSGIAFTLVFFTVFLVSEKINERRRGEEAHRTAIDQFRVSTQETVSNETVEVRPGNTLCLVRDYNTLEHVKKALEMTHTGKRDLVMMTVQLLRGPNTGYEDIGEEHLFTSYEQLLFSRVVSLAEKAGKHVDLLVVPSSNVYQAIVHTAAQLDSSEIVAGRSSVMSPEEQAHRLGEAWEELPNKPNRQVLFRVIDSDGEARDFYLGAHAPDLTDAEVNLIHRLWLEATREKAESEIHHKDIVTLALSRLERELRGKDRRDVLRQLEELTREREKNG
jgi:amino acid transporter